jgi:hypothetical protein
MEYGLKQLLKNCTYSLVLAIAGYWVPLAIAEQKIIKNLVFYLVFYRRQFLRNKITVKLQLLKIMFPLNCAM